MRTTKECRSLEIEIATAPTRTPGRSEDAVLLRELCHRAGNDAATALAALRVLGSGGIADGDKRSRLLSQASARLEASAEIHRLLARPIAPSVEAGAWLRAVGAAVGSAACEAAGARLVLDVPELRLDGSTARRLVMIAAELLSNATKYAVSEDGTLLVSARLSGGKVALRVADDGPGFDSASPARGGGLGGGIVADLVAIGGGEIAVDSGPGGTCVSVELPVEVSYAPGPARARGPVGLASGPSAA